MGTLIYIFAGWTIYAAMKSVFFQSYDLSAAGSDGD